MTKEDTNRVRARLAAAESATSANWARLGRAWLSSCSAMVALSKPEGLFLFVAPFDAPPTAANELEELARLSRVQDAPFIEVEADGKRIRCVLVGIFSPGEPNHEHEKEEAPTEAR